VPLRGVVLALVLREGVREDLLARFGADGADFVVAGAEFGGLVVDGVDVEGRGGRLAGEEAEAVD
jgi:hypothetical protein